VLRLLLPDPSVEPVVDPFHVLARASPEVEQGVDVLLVAVNRGEPNLADNTSELLPEVWHPGVRIEPGLWDNVHIYRPELDGQ